VENIEVDKKGMLIQNLKGEEIFDHLRDALNETPLKVAVGRIIYRKSASRI
jgi:hypothetical protein